MANDDWYAFIKRTAVGPVTFDTLRRMASDGTLTPGDKVKHGAAGSWAEAASVAGILDAAQMARWARPGEPLQDEWYARVMDNQLGPMSQDDLLRLAHDKHLMDTDRVRYGVNGEWVEAREHRWLWGGGPIRVARKVVMATPDLPPAEPARIAERGGGGV